MLAADYLHAGRSTLAHFMPETELNPAIGYKDSTAVPDRQLLPTMEAVVAVSYV